MIFSGWRTAIIYKMRKINPLKNVVSKPKKKEPEQMRVKAENKPPKKSKYWRPSIVKGTRNFASQLALRYAESSEFSV